MYVLQLCSPHVLHESGHTHVESGGKCSLIRAKQAGGASTFLTCTFLSLILYLKFTHIDTHSTKRKSVRCAACQTDSTLFTHFIFTANETTMNLSGLRQYHLSNMISVQKEWLQSLSAIPDPSTLCVWACLGVWYLHLCQVHRWIQIP